MLKLRHSKHSVCWNETLRQQGRVFLQEHFFPWLIHKRLWGWKREWRRNWSEKHKDFISRHTSRKSLLTLNGISTIEIDRIIMLRHETSWYGYDLLSSYSASFSISAWTGGVPPSSGVGFAPCRSRIMRMSGAEACIETLNGDALPHDSIGTSMKLFNRILQDIDMSISLNCNVLRFFVLTGCCDHQLWNAIALWQRDAWKRRQHGCSRPARLCCTTLKLDNISRSVNKKERKSKTHLILEVASPSSDEKRCIRAKYCTKKDPFECFFTVINLIWFFIHCCVSWCNGEKSRKVFLSWKISFTIMWRWFYEAEWNEKWNFWLFRLTQQWCYDGWFLYFPKPSDPQCNVENIMKFSHFADLK